MFSPNRNCDTCACLRNKNNTKTMLDYSDEFDKENIGPLSPMKTEELSFYESNSSSNLSECIGSSPNHCFHRRNRENVDYFDPSSQDSGYDGASHNSIGRFSSYTSPLSKKMSFDSLGCADDEFLESMSDFEPIDENLPLRFKSLINGELSTSRNNVLCENGNSADNVMRPVFRRSFSLQNGNTPNSTKARSCLFKNDAELKSFKRPERPSPEDESPSKIKRSKVSEQTKANGRPGFYRFFSSSEETIKYAVQRSDEEELIGDFSRTYTLPMVPGKHQDLKSISPHTLARVLRGEFSHLLLSFKVIDCRYPYEFDGGHINGAINLYTKEQCLELLDEHKVNEAPSQKRHILIFHCEFSSERGPNLFRYLRKQDRMKNEAAYPFLQYPEIYLLEGGYKSFFANYSEMCVPIAYKEMLHPEHGDDLRFFRKKSKTWNSDSRQRLQHRN